MRSRGGFSAFERVAKPAVAPAKNDTPAAPVPVRKRLAPPRPLKALSVDAVKALLDALRAAVASEQFQTALDNLQQRDWGALKKRAGVARLLGHAWRGPVRESGLGVHERSFPHLLASVKAHQTMPAVKQQSEEVERLLRFIPGALFGSKAGEMKGVKPESPVAAGRGAFSRSFGAAGDNGQSAPAAAPAPPAPPVERSLRDRPMNMGEAKELLKSFRDVCSQREFQRRLGELSGSTSSHKAAAMFVGKEWAQILAQYDFPRTPEGYREVAKGISKHGWNTHVKMTAHEVEKLLRVPQGSFFGIPGEDSEAEEAAAEEAAQQPQSLHGKGVSFQLKHAVDLTVVTVQVSEDATYWDVKKAVADKLGRDQVLKTSRLVKKSGNGTYRSYRDSDQILGVREVLVLGADLSQENDDVGSGPIKTNGFTFRMNPEDMGAQATPAATGKAPAKAAGASVKAAGAPAKAQPRMLPLPQALALQKELLEGFSSDTFQRQLERLEATLTGPQFMRERNKLFQTVQSAVLPKYGFEGTPEGVLEMVSALRPLAMHHSEIQSVGAEINKLLRLDQAQGAGTSAHAKKASATYDVKHLDPEAKSAPKAEAEKVPAPAPPAPPQQQPPPLPPLCEVSLLVNHAVNECDVEVRLKVMSRQTLGQVREALADKLQREDVRTKARFVRKGADGKGPWVDIDDEELVGEGPIRLLHVLGVAFPPEEVQLTIRHAIESSCEPVQLTAWSDWTFGKLREALAEQLGQQKVQQKGRFVFRPKGQGSQGAWVAFKDDEQLVGQRELHIIGVGPEALLPAAPASVPAEPARAEPPTATPATVEPAAVSPAVVNAADPEPLKADSAQAEPVAQEEPAREEPAAEEPAAVDAADAQADSAQAGPVAQEEPAKEEPGAAEPVAVDAADAALPFTADSAQAEPDAQEEAAKVEPEELAQQELGNPGSVEAEPAPAEQPKEEPDQERPVNGDLAAEQPPLSAPAEEEPQPTPSEPAVEDPQPTPSEPAVVEPATEASPAVEPAAAEPAMQEPASTAALAMAPAPTTGKHETPPEKRKFAAAPVVESMEELRARALHFAATMSPACEDMEPQEDDMKAQLWIVVGGEDIGGILVRRGQELASPKLGTRLVTGATIQELDHTGNRLHYRRIHGDGPDFGWVSVKAESGKVLLVPIGEEADAVSAEALAKSRAEKEEAWKKVVAQREAKNRALIQEAVQKRAADHEVDKRREAKKAAASEVADEQAEEDRTKATEQAVAKAEKELDKRLQRVSKPQASLEEAQEVNGKNVAEEEAPQEEETAAKKEEAAKQKRQEEAAAQKEQEAAANKKKQQEEEKKEEEEAANKKAGAEKKAASPKKSARAQKAARRARQKELVEKLTPSLDDNREGDGCMWIVVGGGDKGGILVRKGESFESKPYPVRLATGSRIEEMEVEGNRLHYKRIRGDGPDFGWVNIALNEKALVEPEEGPHK